MASGPQHSSSSFRVPLCCDLASLVRTRLYNIVCNNVTGPVLFLFSLEPAVKYHGITFAPLCLATCGFDASALSPAPTLRR